MITEVENRIVTSSIKSEDRGIEVDYVEILKDYMGQEKVKKN